MIVMLIVFFLGGAWFVSKENSKKIIKQWQEIQVERFMDKIEKTGSCTWEDIRALHQALNYSGVDSEISLEEYRRETNHMGNPWYYLISWTEISEQMLEEKYDFERQSVVKLSVYVRGKYLSNVCRYYVIVT